MVGLCGCYVALLCLASLTGRQFIRGLYILTAGKKSWKTDFWQYSTDSYVINEAFFLKTDLTIREYCYVKQDVH